MVFVAAARVVLDAMRMRRRAILVVPEKRRTPLFRLQEKGNGLDRCEGEGEMKPLTELAQWAEYWQPATQQVNVAAP